MPFDIISYLLGKANQDAPYQPVWDGLEYESGEWIPAENVAHGSISFSNTHTKRPTFAAVFMDETEYDDTLNINFGSVFVGLEDFTNPLIPNTDTDFYALNLPISRTSNATGLSTTGSKNIAYPYDYDYEELSNVYQDFYASKDGIFPYTGSDSRYWQAEKHYKWIAIWLKV